MELVYLKKFAFDLWQADQRLLNDLVNGREVSTKCSMCGKIYIPTISHRQCSEHCFVEYIEYSNIPLLIKEQDSEKLYHIIQKLKLREL